MKEFFQGWRRKSGVVTLLMAIVLTVAWVRSISCAESCLVTCCGRQFVAVSACQRFLILIAGDQYIAVQSEYVTAQMKSQDFHPVNSLPPASCPFFLLRSSVPAISARTFYLLGDGSRFSPPITMIPYSLVVIPLTAISVWLLLFNRRTFKERGHPLFIDFHHACRLRFCLDYDSALTQSNRMNGGR